jgi:hypothetical protein
VFSCGAALLSSPSALAAGHVPARQWAPEIHTPGGTSANWSGYVLSGQQGYNIISATWRVPAVASTSTFTDSAAWIGIDGANNSNLIQAGTEQGYQPGSGAFYDAWWEIFPGSEAVMFKVRPGDNIVVSISHVTTAQWSIYLADTNTGQSFSKLETYNGPQTSAEFVQEAPTVNGSVVPLAHYAPFSFYNVRAGGTTPPLLPAEVVNMIQNGKQVSTPSLPNEANNGFAVRYGAASPPAPATPAFQTHSNGSIWMSTGAACNSSGCPGWREIDNNPEQMQISAGDGSVYELHTNGSIWMWTGGPCTSTGCPGWVEVGDDPTTTQILAGSGFLFAVHGNGSIWDYYGVPCVAGSCTGWTEEDDNPATTDIVAGGNTVYQLHTDGSIWEWTKFSCNGSSCPGWVELDDNRATVEISGNTDTVFQRHSDGSVWESTGAPCGAGGCTGWKELDDNPATTAISAGGHSVYQLHSDGSVWRSAGCLGGSCAGWDELDDNPATDGIWASMSTVYELHGNSRSIWQSTGAACTGGSCPGWRELDDNPSTATISVQHAS